MNGKPVFPTKDGVMWSPQGLLWAQMCAVYGDDLVRIECENIQLWLVKHPANWKTCRGMPKFLNTWLGRAAKKLPKSSIIHREPGIYSGPKMSDEDVAELRKRVM